MDTVWDIQLQSTVLGLVVVAEKKPNENGFSEVDAYHNLVENAHMNLFQRLANSPQSKLLNEYRVARDNIWPFDHLTFDFTLTLEYHT